MSPPTRKLNILLADDDKDDCLFFKEALDELELSTKLTVVHDGEKLMQLLTKFPGELFDVLFLDFNMPRKNGLVCLAEIRQNQKFKALPVIIFSTSYVESIADLLYQIGAQHYICKPADFSKLKRVIQEVLAFVANEDTPQPSKAKFLLNI